VFVAAGQVIRIRTTGGGGWGDPLERPYDEVVRDVAWGKVSVDGARDSYAVLLHRDGDDVVLDEPGSDTLRAEQRASRSRDGEAVPFFDRGPGFARLSGGAPYADVDLL
jgi:N-methylhydantoinase B